MLPAETNTGRKRSRSQAGGNGWNYIAVQLKKQRAKRKKAERAGVSLEEFNLQQSEHQQQPGQSQRGAATATAGVTTGLQTSHWCGQKPTP